MATVSTTSERLMALADSRSVYFSTVTRLLEEQLAENARALAAREEVKLPFSVTAPERARLSTMFRWKVVVHDRGLSSRGPPFVAAVVFLMGLRNAMLMGMDGEEAIYIDGDAAVAAAKGLGYGHICRTHATARLQAGYASEETQLRRLCASSSARVASGARAMLESLIQGDGVRICSNAATCQKSADTIFLNHAMTPCSLAQAVATAKAHGARVVRGVCFFQPEMITCDEGPLAAFPGSFVVDRRADVITFLPKGDESAGFSHPYSSLLSLFLNHEYHDGRDVWLAEKHLSDQGIYHYILRRTGAPVGFPEALSANYYRSDLTRWVELSYLTYHDENSGALLRNPRRVTARVLEAVYEKVMATMMYVAESAVTYEKVFSMLKRHNNSVVLYGDVVEKPQRIWYDAERRAAVALTSLVIARRAETSRTLSVALANVAERFSLRDASSAALFYSAAVAAVGALAGVALEYFSKTDVFALEGLESGGKNAAVRVSRTTDRLEVSVVSGSLGPVSTGRLEPWLPGRVRRNLALLERARAWTRAVQSVSVRSMSSSSSVGATREVSVLDGDGTREAVDALVTVDERTVLEAAPPDAPVDGARRRLYDALVANQDAAAIRPPLREVQCFIGAERDDVTPTLLTEGDPVVTAQQEYDELYPGVSQSDEEAKPYVAAASDLEVRTNFNGKIDDSKRLMPAPRWIRRSRLRTGGAGRIPGCLTATFSALRKRNTDVPANRGYVDLAVTPGKAVQAIIDACYVTDWESRMREELEGGLWEAVHADIAEYVPKVASHQIAAMVEAYVNADEENLGAWLLMAKSTAKVPMSADAAEKVQLPQTIMYSEQKVVNAKYSAMQTRFYKAIRACLDPRVSFNSRDSPVEHERWFNSLQGVRGSARKVYSFAGDITCYDRSQEHVAQCVEFAFYKRHGMNRELLDRWSRVHGEKKALSMMYGILMYIFMQGLSGIWNTLFRNGLVCLATVIYTARIKKEDIVSLDVVGDDFLAELLTPVAMQNAVDGFALTFNLSAKLFQAPILEICSKLWVRVGGWWYFVQNPMRKIESVSNAVIVGGNAETLHERWVSLRDDLRHYDNAVVMEATAEAVRVMHGLREAPAGIISALATLASSEEAYLGSFGPEEYLA